MKNQDNLILVLSVCYGITLIVFGFLVRYYRNEIQRLNDYGDRTFNLYYNCFNKLGIYQRHNFKYSKTCRKLYGENQNLKLEIQGVESLFVDMKNKANEFELKIAELEKGKLKKRDRKKI